MEKETIAGFNGKNYFLSNFYPSRIIMDGIVYPTVEHAFQASKTTSRAARKVIAYLPTPGQAKRAGRATWHRGDWEEIKVDVMHRLLKLKFERDSRLADRLLETGNADLVEANNWNDHFWGVDVKTGEGENMLGKLLMQVRKELQVREAIRDSKK